MSSLFQDLRYTVRTLWKSPGFAAVAILTLALGIGANSAIFSVVNGVLLRPLPLEDSDRLVKVFHVQRNGEIAAMSPATFRDVREQSRTLEDLSFHTTVLPTLTGSGDPVQLKGTSVGANFFRIVGAQPILGRAFTPEENEPGRHHVAILSHQVWQQRFGGDRSVVGRTISLDAEPYEVVGVMPAGFSYPGDRDIWLPAELTVEFMSEESRGWWHLSTIGRLRTGFTPEQAAREVGAIAERLAQAYPETNTEVGMTVLSLHEYTVGDVRASLLVLLGAVGLVLLIACVNVANLLLARGAARSGELAVRSALGAGRGRLVRQLLTESVLLSLLGGAAGILLAAWGTQLLVTLDPAEIPRLDNVTVDATAVAFTAGITLLAGLLFGSVPALQVTRSKLQTVLRSGGRGALPGLSSTRTRNALVIAEMAFSVMLLVGAGLLIKSFVRLQAVDPGFRTERLLSFRLSLPPAAYDTEERQVQFYQRALDRLEALPGVEGAGAVSHLPFSGRMIGQSFGIEGQVDDGPGGEPVAQILKSSPGYFRTAGIPLLRGRALTAADRSGSPQSAVINEEAAHRYFASEDPIGRRLIMGFDGDSAAARYDIVGIVGNVKHLDLRAAAEPAIYRAQAQAPEGAMDVVLRTSEPPMAVVPDVRRVVSALDPNLPIEEVRAVDDAVAASVSQPRFYMLLLSIFAGVALLLAAIGIFGVISYGVTQRTREIGVRVALGAEPASVLRLVVRGAATLAAIGVGMGLLGAWAGTRLLSKLLYGVAATDPLTFVVVAAVFTAVALLAAYLPARRATKIDPIVALRAE